MADDVRASLFWLFFSTVLAAGCTEGPASGRSETPLLKELRGAPRLRRTLLPMLSVPVEFVACPAQTVMPQGLRCDLPAPSVGAEWTSLGAKISAAVNTGADPDALHAAAVLDLITGAAGNTLDRSISYLEMSTRIAPTADRFVDLSAAHLTRAGRDDDERSAIAALDAAARANGLDSLNAAARFNLALALQELGLFDGARNALQRFAALRPESGWGHEADEYRAALIIDTVLTSSDTAMTPDSMSAFATRHSNEARGMAWDRLGLWGRAIDAGDSAGAERHLQVAEAAGNAIAAHHLDPSVADAVSSIRRAGRNVAPLASAHRAFVDGQTFWRTSRSADAERAYRAAEAVGRASPALSAWAAYGLGNNRLGFGDRNGTEIAMRRMLASPAATRYPALAARLHWTLAVVLLRDSRFDEGIQSAIVSRDLYERLGEMEYRAAIIGLLGEAANLGGDARAAYAYFREALLVLRNYPLSQWRHNVLLLMSRAASADGYPAAAALIDAEDDAASRAAKRLPSLVESQLNRVRHARTTGNRTTAIDAIAEGKRIAAQLPAGNTRRQLETELGLEDVRFGAPDQANAPAVLDTAVAYFSEISNFAKQLAAYSARADWLIRAGETKRAESDLDAALKIYSERRDEVVDATQKSLLTQQARRVVDALTLLRIGRGDARGALAARERARESRLALESTVRNVGVVVELALIGDTLVALTVRGDSVTATMSRGDGPGLRSDIELASLALERGAGESVWKPVLERLHDRLIGPVTPRLSPNDTVLTIITDGILSRAPYAALRNATDGSYLIERHALRFASSLRQAMRGRTPLSAEPRALLVAEPTIDRRTFPELSPLPGAASEVDSIAAHLERPRILRGAEVDTTRLKSALTGVELFHFAGHAIFDDARPQRSQLAVGSRGLSASAIAGMKLNALRLVVLSACETNRAPSAAGAGFLGLTESFISAGAGGVVGSLWKVDDESTKRLMRAFYEALAQTRDPVTALRDAQRSMRDMPPGAWGAFRYAGN